MKDNYHFTNNFTLKEMCHSMTAELLHIDNTPDAAAIANLQRLCSEILQPVRNAWGKPLIITSGFRSPQLNKAVGGAAKSYHLKGLAADIHVDSQKQGAQLAALCLQQDLTDLVLIERHKSRFWVHVQLSSYPRHKLISHYVV